MLQRVAAHRPLLISLAAPFPRRNLRWPENDDTSPECRDLLDRLLVLEPKQRLGHRWVRRQQLQLSSRAATRLGLSGGPGILTFPLQP